MRPENGDAALLWDMLQAARAVQAFVEGATLEVYKADLKLRSAVERQLEVLGEAAGRVSATLRASHPEVPWREIVGQRNVLAHDYGEIDDGLVWQTVARDIPPLVQQLRALVPVVGEPPQP